MLPDIVIALVAVAIAVVVVACTHGPDWLARRRRRCDDEALQREIKRWRKLVSGHAVVMLRLSPVVRLHLWCDRCCTSAAIEVDLCMLGDSGVTRVVTYRACRRCDDDTEP